MWGGWDCWGKHLKSGGNIRPFSRYRVGGRGEDSIGDEPWVMAQTPQALPGEGRPAADMAQNLAPFIDILYSA